MRTPPEMSSPGDSSWPQWDQRFQRKDIGILYENEEWLDGLFSALRRRSLPYVPIFVGDAALEMDRVDDFALVLNRVSPSSYLRGHAGAIRYASAFMDAQAAKGIRVINGATGFRLETSKVDQHLLFRRLGIQTPRTVAFTGRHEVRRLASDVRFPAILKPDTGGSGAFVRSVDSLDHLVALLDDEVELFAPDNLLLLQERIASADGSISRLEFLDGELLYAMRVRPTNTFNLCPAVGCPRTPVDRSPDAPRPEVAFEPLLDPPPAAVARAAAVLRAAEIDVGSVEYIETTDGEQFFYDVNASSIFRDDAARAFGVDPTEKLADFVEQSYCRVDSASPARAAERRSRKQPGGRRTA